MKTYIAVESKISFCGILRTPRGSVILVAIENMPIAPAGTTTTFSYDNDGNLASSSNGFAYTWDYNNRMTAATKSGTSTTYGYDFTGERVLSQTGTSTPTYDPQVFYSVTGGTATKSILAGSALTATIVGSGTSSVPYVVLTDNLNNATVLTNASGSVSEVMSYYPFGSLRLDQQSGINNRKKYTSQDFDSITGFTYDNARYLNTTQGQFISQDPLFLGNPKNQNLTNPQALNSYGYAGDNPVTYSDPNGKCAEDGCVGEAIVAGATIGFIGGVGEQYINNVVDNVHTNGYSLSDLYSNLSSPGQYLSSGVRGGAVGATVAFGGAVEASAIVVGALGAGASAVGNIINDRATGQSNNWGGITLEAGVTGLTAGFLETFPGVPGRYPKLLSDAFFTGEHTLNTAAGEFLGVGVGTFTQAAETAYNSNSTYGERAVPSANNGSTIQSFGYGGGFYSSQQFQSIQEQINTIEGKIQNIEQEINGN
jgi:RHS repeat-associated protein